MTFGTPDLSRKIE